MKKLSVLLGSFFFSLFTGFAALSAFDFEVSLLPQYDIYTGGSFDNSFSGTLSFDFFPLTVRERDKLGFGFQGGISAVTAETLSTTPLYYCGFDAVYNARFTDRFGAGAQIYGGLWMFPAVEEKDTQAQSGPYAGARVFADFYVLPELKIGVFAGYTDFIYNPEDFATKIDIGLGFKYSFTRGVFGKSKVSLDEEVLEPIFPVFYSYYNDSPFGALMFFNSEDTAITDVEVSVLIPQYMSLPKVCATFDRVEREEYFSAELTAFINEIILESLASHRTEGKITVSYRSLGKLVKSEQVLDFTTLSRNSMSWADDKRAAAFVSSHDGAANKISRLAKSVILKNPVNDYCENLSYARGIFATLKAYGLSYVKDPTSPFSSSESSEVDFLQFPYQTLLYSGGDCDDLSILNCAIFESIGISAAFITVPGHILMAFDSGISPEKAPQVIKDGRYIIQGGKTWIPLETTVCQDNLEIALKAGYNQWRSSAKKGEAKLYPLSECWETYKAVGVPESDADIELPSVDRILRYLK